MALLFACDGVVWCIVVYCGVVHCAHPVYGAIPQGAAMHAGLPDPLKKTMTVRTRTRYDHATLLADTHVCFLVVAPGVISACSR